MIGKNADIKITVLGVSGKQVRIGVDASNSVPIHREEIYDRLKLEKNVKSFAG